MHTPPIRLPHLVLLGWLGVAPCGCALGGAWLDDGRADARLDGSRAPPELAVCDRGGADFVTIGAAIAAAPADTTIVVCAGHYRERLTFGAKPLALRGAGATTTILDGEGVGTVVTIAETAGATITITGFTIRGGAATGPGGGLACHAGALRLHDAVVADNAGHGGGGLSASACALEVVAVHFHHNRGGARGGGASIIASTGEIRASMFTANTATEGGGLALLDGAVAVLDSQLVGNTAALRGGAIHTASEARLAGNLIADNVAGWTGGGIHVVAHAPWIEHSVIRGNHAADDGGGIYLDQSGARVYANAILGNDSGDDGGGIRAFESAAVIAANLVEGNTAADGGGGIRVSHVPSTLIDNVVRGNRAINTGGGLDLDNDASLVRGGEITGNRASRGGGIFAWLGPWTGLRLEHIRIADNHAWRGGGIFLDDHFMPVTMFDLTIEDNTADRGAGLMVRATDFTLTHSRFRHNLALGRGGALHVGVPSRTSGWPHACPPCPPTRAVGRVSFVVFHDNRAATGSAIWTDAPDLAVENSILSDNVSPAVAVIAAEATPGVVIRPGWRWNDTMPPSFVGMPDPAGRDGNLAAPPGFVAAEAGDFHLAPDSPCVDAADPAHFDLDGTRADLGQYGGVL